MSQVGTRIKSSANLLNFEGVLAQQLNLHGIDHQLANFSSGKYWRFPDPNQSGIGVHLNDYGHARCSPYDVQR